MAKKNLSNYSYFSVIVEYINNLKDGSFVTRKELLVMTDHSSSVDVYRRGLTLLGVLEDTDIVGVFKKVKNIPPFINTTNYLDYSKQPYLIEKLRKYYLTLERKKKIKEIFDY